MKKTKNLYAVNIFFYKRFCDKKGFDVEHEWSVFKFIYPEVFEKSVVYQQISFRNYLFSLARNEETKELSFSSMRNKREREGDTSSVEERCFFTEEIAEETEIADVLYNKCRNYAMVKYNHKQWELFMEYITEGNYRKLARENGMTENQFRVVIKDIIGYARKQLGIVPKKNENKKEKALLLHQQGYTNMEISVKLGVKIESVRKYLNKQGIKNSGYYGRGENQNYEGRFLRSSRALA
jgi:hypothetical protein